MSTPVLDLSEHEIRSIRRWLNQMYPGRDILVSRPDVDFERPGFMLTAVGPRIDEERGRGGGVDVQVTYQIEVLGSDFFQTKREVAEIRERLLTSRLVPLYLWSWQYPSPEVVVVPAEGSLSAGNVSVIVTAVNHQDEESLGSDAVSVTVAAGDKIDVLIPPWPRQGRVAEVFRVYAGAPGSEVLEAEITDLDPVPTSTVVPITALVGGGTSPPATSVSFFYRFMRVLGAEAELLEHPQVDGLFNGYIRARLSTFSQRLFAPVYPVGTISISEEVV